MKNSILCFFMLLFLLLPGRCHLLGQSLVINEIMAANTRIIQDADGDFSDWIELYNAGDQSIALDGYRISDKVARDGWPLPPLVLGPKEFFIVFASGKDRRVPIFWETRITRGDVWRYWPGITAAPEAWNTLQFDDQNWFTGKSGFGYGDNDDATVLPKTLSAFTRKVFQVEEPGDILQILLHVDYDDGFVAYLNGHEIARANIGSIGTPVRFDQRADTPHEAAMYRNGLPELFSITPLPGWLQKGDNVLAIQVHNVDAVSSDLTLIPFLTLGHARPAPTGSYPVDPLLDIRPNEFHSDFKINADGETLVLRDPYHAITDQIAIPFLPDNVCYLRYPDGAAQWLLSDQPTPGRANKKSAYIGIASKPVFSHEAGLFQTPITVSLTSLAANGAIHYTLDGSEPSENSRPYTAPILIERTTVLRVRCYVPEHIPSDVVTRTFFINESSQLPIFSISTHPNNLWDEKSGIYTKGSSYESSFPYFGANFWQDWEKPMHIEFFGPEGRLEFAENAGIKIFGGWSRGYDQKSLAIFFRKQYGAGSLNHRLFPDMEIDRFESFVLRNAGNDWISTLFRDGLGHALVRSLTTLDTQAFRPVLVFLNGQFWGIHNLREKINEHYLATHHQISASSIHLLEGNSDVLVGNNDEYQSLIDFISSNDLADPVNYQYVIARIDPENYIDYMLTEIYCANTDWPGNNIRYWKSTDSQSRWRWILFDLDFGFGMWDQRGYAHNTLQFALEPNGPSWPNPAWSTLLFRKLLQNADFQRQFITRAADLLNTAFAPARAAQLIEHFKTQIADQIPRQQLRWPASATNWSAEVRRLKEFTDKRPAFLRGHLMQKFGITQIFAVKCDLQPSNSGAVLVNSSRIENFPWAGQFFSDLPLRLVAQPAAGHRFVKWSDPSATNDTLQVTALKSSLEITAYFERSSAAAGMVVINEINYNAPNERDPGDWVELYNAGDEAVDLSGWIFQDEDDSHRFVLPNETILPANGYLVLCSRLASFQAIFPNVTNAIGDLNFAFSSKGELLRLYDSNRGFIDTLRYDNKSPWPESADGTGATLELRSAALDNALPQSWLASTILFGTPGRVNSIATDAALRATIPTTFRLQQNYPNPFNGETTIRYSTPGAGWIEFSIFNIQGQAIYKMNDRVAVAGDFQIHWRSTGSSGLYFYMLTFSNQAMRTSEMKKMMVLQ